MGDSIPSYAILSHTWEADHQEVTFQDMKSSTGNSMAHTCCRKGCSLYSNPVPSETRLELQEEDADLKTQLDLIVDTFEAAINCHPNISLRRVWNRWWAKLDEILPQLLPWERGMQYCVMQEEMPSKLQSHLLQIRELRHAGMLRRLGYDEEVQFIEVVKDHLTGFLNLGRRSSR
jgi:hypothetical protein